MALERILDQAARFAAEGRTLDQIASSLQVSRFWVDMVTGTDAFKLLVRRYQDENAQAEAGAAEGGEGDQSGQR